MTLDRERLLQDATYVIENQPESVAAGVARALMAAIVDPGRLLPEGMAIVSRPELLGKGVPGGTY